MNQQDPVRSVSARLWSVVLSALGLVIAINIVWALLRPVLPVVVLVGAAILCLSAWNRRRWR